MPLQMLDGLYINQPSCFLPLAQEARKLAQKIKAEEEASQWSGIPVKQLLNNSFTEQLNYMQSLQQIAPLHAAKDHLPKDIITILERLGKVDNIPFDKLYYLAANCADHYYTSVIKTFVEIIKHSVTDCQIVLVNTARALKYLEDFGQRQSQLFTVLEKYHLLPDNLENLQLQFGFLKQATSKNVEHLKQAINVQQTCTATICTNINNILPCITKLEQTILQLQQKIIMEQHTVQINALDIDGLNTPRAPNNTVIVSVQEYLTLSEPEVLDATEFQAEDDTARESSDFIYNNSEEYHGYDDLPQNIQNHSTEQNQITPGYSVDSEGIPELEEDWDNGQFADADTNLITRHNTHSESERIRQDYTQQLLALSDNQYYEENPVNQLQYSTLILIIMGHQQGDHKKHPMILMVTTLHHPIQLMYSSGMHVAEGNKLSYMVIDILVRKLDQLKVGKPERENKITDNE